LHKDDEVLEVLKEIKTLLEPKPALPSLPHLKAFGRNLWTLYPNTRLWDLL